MIKCFKAFTLIELTVVLVIITLSLTIVFPRFNASSDQRSLLRASTNRIVSIIEYAQQKAACTHLEHFLNIDCQKGTYWITSQSSDSMDSSVRNSSILNGQLPEGIEFSNVKLQGINSNLKNTIVISFSPQGWADPVEILLSCRTGETINVIVDGLSGQIETIMAEEIK